MLESAICDKDVEMVYTLLLLLISFPEGDSTDMLRIYVWLLSGAAKSIWVLILRSSPSESVTIGDVRINSGVFVDELINCMVFSLRTGV